MSDQPIKVFYNSACPVCDAGIAYQKKLMEPDGSGAGAGSGSGSGSGMPESPKASKVVNEGGPVIDWCDVHLDHALVEQLDAELAFVRQRLHVIDAQGELHVGFEAFIALWAASEKEQWKARWSSTPVVRPLLNSIYNGFAYGLYQYNLWRKRW